MSDAPPKPSSPILLTTLLDGDALAAANSVANRYGCPMSEAPCTVGQLLRQGRPMPLAQWCNMVRALRDVLEADPQAVRP